MKYSLLVVCLFFSRMNALEYVKQFENDKVCVSYLKIMAGEEIGEHYDTLPQIVIALDGGVITRLEADGSKTEVEFPTGQSVFRQAETPDKMHKSVNATAKAIAMIIVQLK
jgi:hypothetical protein